MSEAEQPGINEPGENPYAHVPDVGADAATEDDGPFPGPDEVEPTGDALVAPGESPSEEEGADSAPEADVSSSESDPQPEAATPEETPPAFDPSSEEALEAFLSAPLAEVPPPGRGPHSYDLENEQTGAEVPPLDADPSELTYPEAQRRGVQFDKPEKDGNNGILSGFVAEKSLEKDFSPGEIVGDKAGKDFEAQDAAAREADATRPEPFRGNVEKNPETA